MWLESLPPGFITTWADMKEKFMNKCFPPSKTTRLRSFIHAFKQEEGESFYETWERFKELLHRCPHHGLEDWALVEKFYDGVGLVTKNMLDTTSGGNLMSSKTPEECMDLGFHDTIDWPMGRAEEEVDFVGNPNRQNRDFGNSFNSGWRNHPGFSGRNGNNQGSQHQRQSLFHNPSEGQGSGPSSGQSSGQSGGEKRPTLEKMMTQQSLLLTQFMERDEARYQKNQMKFQEHSTMI
ncbi:hypothetical protein L1987_21022 [Smallanthus sonchifolius]|uniref:Uncharacterized protein n=1 Tax=Smallanthus sonchifolius TaxID=185202 RepID=A0ACB9IUY7_9ASTR|nr:hypothetical protein L1987_21022 [Smallanthus sonchifolius]